MASTYLIFKSRLGQGIVLTLSSFIIFSCEPSESEGDEWWTDNEKELIVSELDRTTNEVLSEIESLNQVQWTFKEDSTRWSIAEITEHLVLQNLLHYRELSVTSLAPQQLQFRTITEGRDDYFTSYATDATPGKAQWYLQPHTGYKSIEIGRLAFLTARNELTTMAKETGIDFRKQFTFRTPVEGKSVSALKIGEVRDLHQLLLTGIAHTDRHLRQIRKIKEHPRYPN